MSWVRYLKEVLARREAEKADLRTFRAVRPRGRGRYVVKACHRDNDFELILPQNNPGQTYEPGEIVLVGAVRGGRNREILGPPPSGAAGAAAFPPSEVDKDFDFVRIQSASPETLESGSTGNQVFLIGRGFKESPLDTFEAVALDEAEEVISDPYVTITAVAWVADPEAEGLEVQDDQTVVELTVDVSGLAPDGYSISYKVSR